MHSSPLVQDRETLRTLVKERGRERGRKGEIESLIQLSLLRVREREKETRARERERDQQTERNTQQQTERNPREYIPTLK